MRPRGGLETASQRVVGTVAERFPLGRLAAAEPQLFGLGGDIGHRHDAGIFVRAVAERLRLTATAGAPEVALALFDGDVIGRLLRRNRCGHLLPRVCPWYARCPDGAGRRGL